MTVHCDHVLEAAKVIFRKNALNTWKYTTACSGITAASAVCASLLLGPIGPLIGSSAAGLLCYVVTREKFESLWNSLTPKDKEELYFELITAFKDATLNDLESTAAMIYKMQKNPAEACEIIKNFLTSHQCTAKQIQ